MIEVEMPDTSLLPTPMDIRVREMQVRSWLAGWLEAASHLISSTLGDGKVTLQSKRSGEWLFDMSWTEEYLRVREPDLSEPYTFQSLDNALAFLNAVLESYVERLTERGAGSRKAAFSLL